VVVVVLLPLALRVHLTFCAPDHLPACLPAQAAKKRGKDPAAVKEALGQLESLLPGAHSMVVGEPAATPRACRLSLTRVLLRLPLRCMQTSSTCTR
jgi:hypothetical protein